MEQENKQESLTLDERIDLLKQNFDTEFPCIDEEVWRKYKDNEISSVSIPVKYQSSGWVYSSILGKIIEDDTNLTRHAVEKHPRDSIFAAILLKQELENNPSNIRLS